MTNMEKLTNETSAKYGNSGCGSLWLNTQNYIVILFGIQSWKKRDFFQFCEEGQGWKIEFLKGNVMRFWKQN